MSVVGVVGLLSGGVIRLWGCLSGWLSCVSFVGWICGVFGRLLLWGGLMVLVVRRVVCRGLGGGHNGLCRGVWQGSPP